MNAKEYEQAMKEWRTIASPPKPPSFIGPNGFGLLSVTENGGLTVISATTVDSATARRMGRWLLENFSL